jgi:tRNA 5-methylaminomethyl-2-thiouridine biosynthesis bifunctional protein
MPTRLNRLSRTERWNLRFADGKEASHASVVLANGHHISQFIQTETLPVYPVGGQVSHIPPRLNWQTAPGAVL